MSNLKDQLVTQILYNFILLMQSITMNKISIICHNMFKIDALVTIEEIMNRLISINKAHANVFSHYIFVEVNSESFIPRVV